MSRRRRPAGEMRRRNPIAAIREINRQFASHAIEMLRSPAWRVLSLSARRVLDRLAIELADHGGFQRAGLPVMFDDFEQYGIDRACIAPAGSAD